MRIVSVPQKVVVAYYIECGFHRRLVAAEGHKEVAFEILSRAFAQILVFRVAAEVPMLLHPLQPVRNPSAVSFDLYDAQLGKLFDDAVPDETSHRGHRLEWMRQDVAGDVGVYPVAERLNRRGARIVRGNRAPELFDLGPERQVVVMENSSAADRIGAHVKADGAVLRCPIRFRSEEH